MPERKPSEEDNFFVGIEDPTELRRQLLEASKRLVEVLKKYEAFREKRMEKLAQIEKLKRVMNDINRLNMKLRSLMPRTTLRVPHKMADVPEKPMAKMPMQRKEPISELEKLESELAEIENKLGKLGR